MAVRFPLELPAQPTPDSATRGVSATLVHGELLLGKVARIGSDGQAAIRFPNFDAKSNNSLLQAGNRVFAYVQKTRDEAVLSLLPNVEEGDVLSGTAVEVRPGEVIAKFGDAELRVRLPNSDTPAPALGAPVRAQVQVLAGRPILRMLPENATEKIMDGTVLAARGDGTVLIDAGGTVLIAAAGEGFVVGDHVQAALQQVVDKLILQIVTKAEGGKAAMDASSSQMNISGFQPREEELLAKVLAMPQYARLVESLVLGELKVDGSTRDLLSVLQQLTRGIEANKGAWLPTLAKALETILLSPQKESFPEQVLNAFKDSGIFLESRLLQAALSQEVEPSISGDLKLALLIANRELSRVLQPSSTKSGELPAHLTEIAGKVGQLLDAVTAEQFLNLRMLPSRQIYLQLPFAGETELDRVEIRISHQGKQKSRKIDPRNASLTLAVTTSKLGKIKASISIIEGQITCQFKATRKPVVDLFVENLDILKHGLEKLNYRVTYIDCSLSSDEREFSLLDKPASFPQKGFDVRI